MRVSKCGHGYQARTLLNAVRVPRHRNRGSGAHNWCLVYHCCKPSISEYLINLLKAAHVICQRGGSIGAPVYFHASTFPTEIPRPVSLPLRVVL